MRLIQICMGGPREIEVLSVTLVLLGSCSLYFGGDPQDLRDACR